MIVLLALVGIGPAGLMAQQSDSEPQHGVVESTFLVLDHARVSRLGLKALMVSTTNGVVRGAHAPTTDVVRVGTRMGGPDLSAFLEMVRSEYMVRRESTQKIVTLSDSAAQVTSQPTFIGAYGQAASAGPALWVEPLAL